MTIGKTQAPAEPPAPKKAQAPMGMDAMAAEKPKPTTTGMDSSMAMPDKAPSMGAMDAMSMDSVGAMGAMGAMGATGAMPAAPASMPASMPAAPASMPASMGADASRQASQVSLY